MLNMWPEKTLLLALEFAKHGKPDETLHLIKSMLPEHLHRKRLDAKAKIETIYKDLVF